MKNSIRVSILALAALAAFKLPTVAHAATNVVVPGANAATEGNIDNGFPFDLGAVPLTSQRYQQVYGASDFSAINGPHLITDILFRPDSNDGNDGSAFNSTLANVQIDLSTTSKAVDNLSTTFASNVGANDAIVYSGALALSSAFTGSGPKDFDILIHLTTPFTYNPAGGNLLMDVRNFSGGTTTFFDAETGVFNADAVSRVYTLGGGVTATTAATADSTGLITKFVFDGVAPEPSSLGLLGVGALGLIRRRR